MREERFEEFASSIAGIHGAIQKIKAEYTQELGIKVVHVFWIYLLRTHPEGMSAAELARAGRSTNGLVSREVGDLVKLGIVATDRTTDRRRYGWKFLLTDKGREVAERIGGVARVVQDYVSRDVPPEDLVVFYRTLGTLLDNFVSLADGQQNMEKLK